MVETTNHTSEAKMGFATGLLDYDSLFVSPGLQSKWEQQKNIRLSLMRTLGKRIREGDATEIRERVQEFYGLGRQDSVAERLTAGGSAKSEVWDEFYVRVDTMRSGRFHLVASETPPSVQPHSDVWRRMRRATHEGLSKSSATAYHPGQMTESASLALELLHYPSQWLSHVQRANASFTINFLYGSNAATDGNATLKMDGMTTTSEDTDSRIAEINEFAERLATSLLPGAHLVEFFPWMKYIPARFAKWKRVALESFKTDSAIFERMMAPAYASLTRGEEPSSLMGKISKDQDRYNLTSGERAWAAATMYTAGAETVSSVMAWWVQAMALYPEAQARAQSELDNFVGRARLPTFADYENLPYIRAMVKEILRWGLVAPFGLPHASTVDDYYKGYFIPANSLIIPNIWLLNRDPLVWGPDAMEFRPERHIYDGTELRVPAEAREEGHFTFGFGRRVCVGKHVGNNSLFMEVVTILWAMNIERPKNQDGLLVPIDSDGCVDTGLTVRPTSFDIKVTPRFPEAMTILEHEKDVLKR